MIDTVSIRSEVEKSGWPEASHESRSIGSLVSETVGDK